MTIYTNSVWVTSWIITQKTKNKKEMTIYTNSVWVERGKNNSEILEYSYINNLNNKRTQSFNYENKKIKGFFVLEKKPILPQ